MRHDCLLLLLGLMITPAFAQRAALFDELDILYPDTDATTGTQRLASDTPRGVPAGMHVLVTGLAPDATLTWQLRIDGTPVPDARAFQLLDVPVEQNTGLSSRTEAWDKKPNPHVIRRAPFRVFEVLRPIDQSLKVGTSGVLALRVEVPLRPENAPGTRNYTLDLASGGWRHSLQWELTVHPVTVPPLRAQQHDYTNWFSPAVIAERHGLEPWSEPFWNMLGCYADLMARGRQNTFWVRWSDFTARTDSGAPQLDAERLARYVQIYLDRGFTCLEGGHLAHRHGGNWDSPRLDFFLTGSDVTSDVGRAELTDFLVALRSTLAELNPPPSVRYLQHLTDEPTDTNATSYKALAEQVRTHMPGVRIFEATMSLAVVGAVDVWCPQVQEYQRNRAFFDARRQAGDGVWIYTCLIPGGPWLNRLLDQERLRPVLLGWSLEASDLDGFLHWGLNHYRPGVDPFEQSVVPHGDGPPNFLPAGDSHVLYPGPDGPLSGQRFESHRIGLEDAALLRMLKTHHPQRAAELVQAVFRGFDDYERDVTAYRATRRHLLTALDSKEPADAGVLLFNGRDLAGWTAYFPDGTKTENVWRVEDGILICKGQPAGYLRTKEQFTNFRLTLQWRWNPATQQAGNSGVLLRVIGAEMVWPRCVEAQLQHGNAGDFWNIGDFPMQTEPDRTQGRNTRKLVAAERPVGEWNEYDILVDGGRIVLRINGQLVNEASDVLEVPGWIALQSEGTEIHFREIRIQR